MFDFLGELYIFVVYMRFLVFSFSVYIVCTGFAPLLMYINDILQARAKSVQSHNLRLDKLTVRQRDKLMAKTKLQLTSIWPDPMVKWPISKLT